MEGLEGLVVRAVETAQTVANRDHDLLAARALVLQRAALAEQRVCAFFAELQAHHQALRLATGRQQKRAAQGVSDVVWCLRALRAVQWSRCGHTPSQALDDELAFTVVQHAAACIAHHRHRHCHPHTTSPALTFSAPPGFDLPLWRLRCAVHTQHDWEPRAPGIAVALAPMLQERAYFATAPTPHGGVVVGGAVGTVVLGDSEWLHVSGNRDDRGTWQALPDPLPSPRCDSGACVVGNGTAVLVVVGGEKEGEQLADVAAFHTGLASWFSLPSFPGEVAGCGVVAVGGCRVVVVGGTTNAPSDKVWELDIARFVADPPQGANDCAWTALPSLARPRASPATAVVRVKGTERVVACGGYNNEGGWEASCEWLEDGKGEWSALPPMPLGVSGAACSAGGGNVFVVCGYNGVYSGDVLVLVTATMQWTHLRSAVAPRGGCGAVCVGRRLLVFGGFDGARYLNSCECLQF